MPQTSNSFIPEKPIPYGRQEITDEDKKAVLRVLESDFLTQGPLVEAFEHDFSEFIGSKYAVALSNGTAALHLSVKALGLKPGEKVITSPISFVATANAILYAQGKVEFADIDRSSYLIDLNIVEDKLKKDPKIRGIVPIDFAGLPVKMDDVQYLSEKYGTFIIEDSCHAPGASFQDSKNKWQKSGSCSHCDAAIFSFHPVKHIATGEGGMVTTNNKSIYQSLMLLRTHGITKDKEVLQKVDGGWYYEMQDLGFNYRITDIQSALGISQLGRAEERLKRRLQIAKSYEKALKDLPLTLQKKEADQRHAYHLFTIETERRSELYNYLRENNIFAQVHYIPIHTQPYYRKLGFNKGDFPNAEEYYSRCLSIPMYPSLTSDELEYVIHKIKVFFN